MSKRTTALAPMIAAGAIATLLYLKSQKLPPYLRAGRVAIITGGSSGLGLAMAHRFGRAGLKLVLAARKIQDLEQARHELVSQGSVASRDQVQLFGCDVSDQKQADGLIHAAIEAFGRLDILINNAGLIEVGPMEDQPIDAYERAMGTNFFGALYTSYAALPWLLKQPSSAIVNISSVGGKLAVPHMLPYVASKFALTGFSQGMHAELLQKGVNVTTVCPGLMRTGGETHAEFRGQIEKEKAWFQTSARMPLVAASVTHAAEKIFSAVKHRRVEVTITPQAWLAARFAGLAPESTQAITALVNRWILPATTGNYVEPQPAYDE